MRDGTRLGEQVKTQIDPSEEAWYVPGSGRRTFTVDGLTFGIAICHEAYRYPEITRALALAGAQVVFVPHYVVTDDGSLPTRWCDAANPYNEKSLMVRALENTIYVAAANNAGPTQGSVTGIIAPDGTLVASLPYGEVGRRRGGHRPRCGGPPDRPPLGSGPEPPGRRLAGPRPRSRSLLPSLRALPRRDRALSCCLRRVC